MAALAANLPVTILLLPLLGCVLIALVGPYVHRTGSAIVGCLSVFASFIGTVIVAGYVWHLPAEQQALALSRSLGSWAHIPPLTVTFGVLIDPLALVWMLIVTGVGFLIHLYSVGYMAGAKNYRTFFAYMNLFVFTMLLLVMADNFLWLLVGWAGVGLASYLLIGFDNARLAAVLAARKALIMNVIGDVGIMIAIFLMYAHLHSVSYGNVFSNVNALGTASLTWIGIWLFIGAAAKSAQLPLHTWLPDAMEGPTPVSALIHAATMVTAGVYLVARAHPIYDHAPIAAGIVATVGALTAIFAATIGCVQYDIKRVLAYSTMSQIGYMVLAVGIGAYSAGVFHFMTHAFFKALLFMAAGIVIHDLAGEQDIRKMGGLAKAMPFAFGAFLIGTLAICGVPPFAGFFSKDAVIDQALRFHHPMLAAIGIVTALLTAFYMFRLLMLTFLTGPYRGGEEPQAHSGATMRVPVLLLCLLSICGGWLVVPGHDALTPALRASFADVSRSLDLRESNLLLTLGTLIVIAAGIWFASFTYRRRAGGAAPPMPANDRGLRALLGNAYYLDDIYRRLAETPSYWLADSFAARVDPQTFSGFPRLVAHGVARLGDVSRNWETGYLRRYGLTIAVSAVLLLVYYLYIASATGVPLQ